MNTETKLQEFQAKVNKLTEELINELQDLNSEMDYKNGSVFSYNVDRLKHFNKNLQEFKIRKYPNK